MLKRIREDFQLGIVTLFGISSAAVVLPFAIYRFMTGSYTVGLLDSIIVLGSCALVMLAVRFGKVEQAGKVFVIFNCTCVILSTHFLGFTGVFWMYAVILSNFFLTRSQIYAGIFTIPTIFLITFHTAKFDTSPQLWAYLTTNLLISVLSAFVSYRYKVQKNKLELLASVDTLTGAFNRRIMRQEILLAVDEYSRKGTPMAAILMDIDHFKTFNDRFGHEIGDDILTNFSKLVLNITRKSDMFFRYGGEEFLMLVKNCNLEEARIIAEKIRVEALNIDVCVSERITVSLGVAVLQAGESSEQWILRADKAMYHSKAVGRNQVTLYTEQLNFA